MTTQVRVGIIGAGIMGRNHAASVATDPRARVVGVASLPLEAAQRLADEHDADIVTDDYRELLAHPDVDLVSIATPDHLHAEICLAAAAAGKHFLVEKPLTTDLAEADTVIEAVAKSGVIAMCSFNHRWIAPYAEAYNAVSTGRIGTPKLAYARKNDRIFVPTQMLSWASSTTPAWFLSSHDIDLVNWYFGAPAIDVYATAVWGVLRDREINTPDAIQAQVRYDGGGVATFESCWIYPDTFPTMTDSFIEIVGTDGVVHLPRQSDQVELSTHEGFEYPRTSVGATAHGQYRGAVREAVQHMVTCVLERRPPLVTLESSRHVTAVLDALHRSLESGGVEKLR